MIALSKSADAESTKNVFFEKEFDNDHHAELILSADQLHSFEHRQNYQFLKNAYKKLQDAYAHLESELSAKVKELKAVKVKHTLAITDAEKSVKCLTAEYDKAAKNELTQERLELIKMQISCDIEDYYRMQINQAHDSVTKSLSESIRLQKEVCHLKSQLEGERNESHAIIENNRLLYEKELTNLRSLKEEMESRLANISSFKLDNELEACQETSTMMAKIAALTNELESSKLDMHNNKQKQNNEIRTLIDENADLKAKHNAADIERDSLKKQLHFIKSEFSKLREELEAEKQTLLETSRQAADKEVQLQRISQRARIDLANLRSEAQQQQAKIEAQRDEVIAKSQVQQSELDIITARCKHFEATANARELQAEERLARVHEQAVGDVTRLETELERVQTELSETRKATSLAETARKATEERLSQAIAHGLKVQTDSEQMFHELKLLKLKHLEEKYLSTANCAPTIAAQNDIIKNAIPYIATKETPERNWAKQEETLQNIEKSFQAHLDSLNKKKQLSRGRLKRLKYNLQALAMENMKLKTENVLLRNNVPRQEYERVRNCLVDLRKRHDEYKEILLCSTNTLPVTEINENSLQQI